MADADDPGNNEDVDETVARVVKDNADAPDDATPDAPNGEDAVAVNVDAAREACAAPTQPKQENEEDSARISLKPSYTLFIRGLPKESDMSELEMRLKRFGDVVSLLQQEDGVAVAKFSRTQEAYAAREKLNGAEVCDGVAQIEFGPQDPEHYNRGKNRLAGRGRGMDPDAPKAAGTNKTSRGMRSWPEDANGLGKAAKGTNEDATVGATWAKTRPANFGLTPPQKSVSKWSVDLSFEQQLEDFMKMPRRGMYNRYLVLGKLPPELRTGQAIWRMMQPVQRDIVHIEMLTCFGKPVSHIALRSATAAAAMHRLCEQMHPNLTVAFAPPRKASSTLWLGNVDDFVPRKDLEELLGEFGRVVNGMRYLPVRTCAFASFTSINDAIHARNTLYGLEVQRNQFLNVDFVDEGEQGYNESWGQPWAAVPWNANAWTGWQRPMVPEWGHAPVRRGDDWKDGPPRWGMQPPPRGGRSPGRGEARGRRRSRSRSRGGNRSDEDPSPAPERPRKRQKRPQSPQKKESDSEEPIKSETKLGKTKVRLFKMGEFCCNIVANFVKGKEQPDALLTKLPIDQRTKIDHCKAHLERAGKLATVWHFSAADRRDCAAYDALCDYFVEKQRVGLVQTPSYYVYLVPPTDEYFKQLGLAASNFVVGLQIPLKK